MTMTRGELVATLPNGTFTIESPKGGHRTFRVATVKRGKLEGKRILSLLSGADNEGDYQGFAFVMERGVIVWRKFRAPMSVAFIDGVSWDTNWSAWQKMATMLWSLSERGEESKWHDRGYRLLWEGRCVRCNRKLTVPESIRSGIGPVCAGRE